MLHSLAYTDGSCEIALLEEFMEPRRCIRESLN